MGTEIFTGENELLKRRLELVGYLIRKVSREAKEVKFYEKQKDFDYIKVYNSLSNCKIDTDLLVDYLLEKSIIIDDIENLNNQEKKALTLLCWSIRKKKTGNIVGYLSSPYSSSYSKTKNHSKKELKGKFEDIIYILFTLGNVGWERNSSVAVNDESTALNFVMDKKSFELAKEVIQTSSKNKESSDFPISGLISSIQALRYKGLSEDQILYISKQNRLDEIVYNHYQSRKRKTFGSKEVLQIMMKDIQKETGKTTKKEVHEILKQKLNWDM